MINKIKPKSEFSKNVITLITGTTVAQAIPIAISPILTRIYTPQDFGVLALFVAISSIFGSIANGRYDLAIMIPKSDKNALNIAALSFIITFFISLILLFLVILFDDYFVRLLSNDDIKIWLYFIPLAIFFTGFYNIVSYYSNRKKYYNDIKNATIIKSIILASLQILVGFFKSGATGLILGQLASNLFANLKLLKNMIKDKNSISDISFAKMIILAKKYKNFPKFLLPSNIINTISGQLTTILFSNFFNLSVVGFLSFSEKTLNMPITLITKSIYNVFMQEASLYYAKNKECVNLYKNTFKKLLILSILPFSVLLLFSPFIFSFVFGKEWEIAGKYVQILIPMYFIKFITIPFGSMFVIAGKQKLDLYWQIYLIITVSISILVGYYLFQNIYATLGLFSMAYSLAYIINGIMTFKFSKGE